MNNLFVSKLRCIFVLFMFVVVVSLGSGQDVYAKDASKTHLYLVSVGSGDQDNITLRAINTIKDSDIIFCDKRIRDKFSVLLADKEIHDTGFGIFGIYGKTPEEAKKNKRFNYEEKLKEFNEINSIIRQAVKEGKTVSVLDSGDVTIYGPHMWYMEAFEDLNPEIIPGISCFNAANAALKKGVTSGKKTHSVILTASFGKEDYEGTDSIEKLAANQSTMVFFTMFLNMEEVVKKLRTHYPPDTPIAIVIYAGYKEKEKVIHGTLDTILEKTKGENLPHEHLIYVGDFLTNRYKAGN
ncbi:MAG: SAM-dependent methyltransferase [Candidatus Kryptoniota bacterium]